MALLVAGVALLSGTVGYLAGRSARPSSPLQATTAERTPAIVRGIVDGAAAVGDDGASATRPSSQGAGAPTRDDGTRASGGMAAQPPGAGTSRTVAAVPRSRAGRRVMLGDLDLTAIGHDRGDRNAPLVLVDFSDYGCPYCGEFARETFPVIDREYVQTGKVFLKYVPFLAGFENGREATRAAECAADQGRFWEMSEAVYATQSTWQKARDPHAALLEVAVGAGVDSAAYRACYDVHRTDGRTRRATKVAEQVQVRVTPSFVLNGRAIEGALPLAEFRKLLDLTLLLAEADK